MQTEHHLHVHSNQINIHHYVSLQNAKKQEIKSINYILLLYTTYWMTLAYIIVVGLSTKLVRD
jgi:uncharacterized membrane protein